MYEGERQRKPLRVVVLVVGMWVLGNILEALLGAGLAGSGMVPDATAVWVGRIIGWGVLAVVAYVYRERLDDWLRDR